MMQLKELATIVGEHHGLEPESVARVLLRFSFAESHVDELGRHPGRLQPFDVEGCEGKIEGFTGWVLAVGCAPQSLCIRQSAKPSPALSDECIAAYCRALEA